MNLLPKSHEDFGQKEYWNTFFKKRGKVAFEWYGEYPELCGQLHKYIKPKDEILMVGCGNSKLSTDMYDLGFKQMTNIDISQVVIKQMNEANKVDRPDLKYIHMDALAMKFEDSQFSVVLDKGTLDALMTDDTDDVRVTANKYFAEISRVLRIGGRYVCVSLLQEHIIKELLEYFPNKNWMFRVVRCLEAEQKTVETDGTAMPVFIVIATKFKQLPMKILEVCMGGEKMERLEKPEEILTAVSSTQKAALVCNGLHKGNIAGMEEVSLDLYRPGESIPRFTLHILDQNIRGNGKYAAFIVPQGRETEWLFSTTQGRKKLLVSANHNRLAIVSMHRGQLYTTWDSVKDELSENIRSLAPFGLKEQIPYLSLGSEVGKRETIFKGRSDLSGDYIVEEIAGQDNKIFRRLIFLSNQFVIQSEALVKIVKTKNNKKIEKIIDSGYLACQHHLFMTVGVRAAIQNEIKNKKKGKKAEVLVVGLGGGGLCSFMQQFLRDVNITAVEIDEAMEKVATDYFGLSLTGNIKVIIDDGIVYLKESAKSGKVFKSILFDVDSKDHTVGMSCPPKAFLEKELLDAVKVCLGDSGIFVLNLACRDEKLRDLVLKDLRNSFKFVCSYKLNEDINEVLYCRNDDKLDNLEKWKNCMETSASDINALGKKFEPSSDEMVEIEDFLSDLKL